MIDEKVGASVSVAAINGRGNGIAAVCALMMAAALWAALTPAAHAGAYDVTTYHYDAQRTGWNPSETTLDWSNVNSAQFGLLNSIPLDEQVDAQALVVSAATLAAKGIAGYPNDLVYVATENNTIYAIDSVTGVTMFQTHLGTPVSANSLPGQCINNSAVIGITSTPVIDLPNGVMYVIAASVENSAAVYRIHELSIATLVDVVPSVIISASQTLSDGTVTKFWPAFQRQRPGLLLSNGVVYAGFGSYCDLKANLARGWLMGWTTGNLQPLPNVGLTDRQTAAETGNFQGGNFYLSSFWASGYGLAADPEGYIYAQTGNSDTIRSDNLPDSALKIAPGITSLAGYFTPSNFAGLDSEDADLGSGGIMVVPETPGLPHFAVGGGKDGRLFLYNRNNMGGFAANGVDAPASVQAGQCWCGPSYFVGSDGKPRVERRTHPDDLVSSHDDEVAVDSRKFSGGVSGLGSGFRLPDDGELERNQRGHSDHLGANAGDQRFRFALRLSGVCRSSGSLFGNFGRSGEFAGKRQHRSLGRRRKGLRSELQATRHLRPDPGAGASSAHCGGCGNRRRAGSPGAAIFWPDRQPRRRWQDVQAHPENRFAASS